jgi:hypothetical protein
MAAGRLMMRTACVYPVGVRSYVMLGLSPTSTERPTASRFVIQCR